MYLRSFYVSFVLFSCQILRITSEIPKIPSTFHLSRNETLFFNYALCSTTTGDFDRENVSIRTTDSQNFDDSDSRVFFEITLKNSQHQQQRLIEFRLDSSGIWTIIDGNQTKFSADIDDRRWNSLVFRNSQSEILVQHNDDDEISTILDDDDSDGSIELSIVRATSICFVYKIDSIDQTGGGEWSEAFCTAECEASSPPRCLSDEPCLNDGRCIRTPTTDASSSSSNSSFVCLCLHGHAGRRCEIKTTVNRRPCVTNICANGGTCFIEANRHRCTCAIGFRGQKCEQIDTRINKQPSNKNSTTLTAVDDPCSSEPCRNGGTCRSNTSDATIKKSIICTCPKGFSGDFCEVRRIRSTDICANTVCEPGQRCVSISGGVHKCVSISPIVHNNPPPILADDATPRATPSSISSPSEAIATTSQPIAPPLPPLFPSSDESSNANDSVSLATKMTTRLGTTIGGENEENTCDVDTGTTVVANRRRCSNGGRCLPNNQGGFACVCSTGWTGKLCENAIITNCGNRPCSNNGSCLVGADRKMLCKCKDGFTGTHCETNIDDCVNIQCPAGKLCIDGMNSYECRCPPTFFGADCEFEAVGEDWSQECAKCKHGATCLKRRQGDDGEIGNFTCACRPGYTGRDCEREVDECELHDNPCLNGGTCVDGLVGFECRCRPGYTGLRCDGHSSDACQTKACPNGTVCAASAQDPKGYVCIGTTTTSNSVFCDENSCQNGAMCINNTSNPMLGGFKCVCLPGFSGVLCESTITSTTANDPKIGSGLEKNQSGIGSLTDGGNRPEVGNFNESPLVDQPSGGTVEPQTSASPNPTCDDGSPNPCQNGGTCRIADDTDNNDGGGLVSCICPTGFIGSYCEDDVDECEIGNPCGDRRKFICVNTIGGHQCECANGWTGNQCDVELIGCRANPPCGSNMACKPNYFNGEHGHSCECASGSYGSDCTHDSTVSFNGNSLFYHLSTSPAAIAAGQSNYSIKFRFRTALTNVIVVEGVDITPSIVYTIRIRDGRLNLDWTTTAGDKATAVSKSIDSRSTINDGEWYGVQLQEEGSVVRLIMTDSNGTTLEAMSVAKSSSKSIIDGSSSSLPVFTTKFGGLSSTSGGGGGGRTYFVGCMQDMFVNEERLVLIDGQQRSHTTAINVTSGCQRRLQCARGNRRDAKEAICGGPTRGRCVDMWSTRSCHCRRPYLAPDCRRSIKEATFGYEGNSSYVELQLNRAEKKSVEMYLDLSMLVRTRSADGLLAYLGSNLNYDNPNNAYQSFVTLELIGGRLKSLVHLGTSKPQMYVDEGGGFVGRSRTRWSDRGRSNKSMEKSSTEDGGDHNPKKKRRSSRRRVDDGRVHTIRLVRRENEIRGFVDDAEVFAGRLSSPFPYPLLIDHFYAGGMPSGGVAMVTRQKRQQQNGLIDRSTRQSISDAHQITRQSFKGTIQDVRINDRHVPLLKKHAQELAKTTTTSKLLLFGDPVPHNNVLDGTISDDVCKWRPCQNSGTCKTTFNDYECACIDGWWGKNCTEEDVCVRQRPCAEEFDCRNLQKSPAENGYVCVRPITLDESSSAMFHMERAADGEESEEDREDTTGKIEFAIRTRSKDGVILMIVDGGGGSIAIPSTPMVTAIPTPMIATIPIPTIPAIPTAITEEPTSAPVSINHTAPTIGRPKGRRVVRDPRPRARRQSSSSSIFHPDQYLIIRLVDGSLDLHFASKRSNIDVHLKNTTGDFSINDGQWHEIAIEFGRDGDDGGIGLRVDDGATRKLDFGGEDVDDDGDVFPFGALLDGNPIIHVGGAPKQFLSLVGGGVGDGQSFKGCLKDARIGKDGWLVFQSQSSSWQQLASYSRSGRIFYANSSTSIRDDGCHSDDVCHSGTNRMETCRNGATCEDEWNRYKCHCPFGFKGETCEINIDDCEENRCANGAVCVDGIGNYTCACVFGYAGEICEINIDECAPEPCQNNGTCVDLIGAYECQCSANYTGSQCEIWLLVDCASNPCYHGGQCSDTQLPTGEKTFNCSCPPAYFGRACEKEKNFCVNSPCINGGNCTSHAELLDYRCSCPIGFKGRNCEENIDECLSKPCVHGQCVDGYGNFTCECSEGWTGQLCDQDIDECQNAPCTIEGRTVCLNTAGSYRCECPQFYFGENCEIEGACLKQPCVRGNCSQQSPSIAHHCSCPYGYTGGSCETEINFCDSDPCQNGATCQPFVGGYQCACVFGFTGIQCETNINECDSQPCENRGVCIDGIGEFVCNCSGTGFDGAKCHEDVDECRLPAMCLHSTECRNSIGSYECDCQSGYMGTRCDLRNPCVSNATHSCQNGGRCVNPRLKNGASTTRAPNLERTIYDCECIDGFHGEFCQMQKADSSGLAGRLEYILGPVAGAIGVILIIVAVLFVLMLRKKRATHGTYSPSRQEITGARMQMGAMMKPPPEERLI